MMRGVTVSCLVLASLAAWAQAPKAGEVPTRMRIEPPGKAPWKKSKVTAAQLGQKVGDATMRLQNTGADLIVLVQTPEGQGFFSAPTIDLRVMGGKLYRVDSVVLHEIPFSSSTANDGKIRTVRINDKIVKMNANQKLQAASLKGADQIRLFETDFTRMMFQGLTDGIDAWKPILTGWATGVNGYKSTIEERTMKHMGQTFRHYRVHAQRTGALVKTLGQCTFEIIIDADRMLPVTVRHVRVDTKGKTWAMMWTASYRFKQVYTLEDMTIGNKG